MLWIFAAIGTSCAEQTQKHRCKDYEIFDGMDYGFDERYTTLRKLRVWTTLIPVCSKNPK